MHIAFLTPEYPHKSVHYSAGIGTSIKNLATALVESGYECTLFIYGQKVNQIFVENGIHFHLIKQKQYKVGGFYFYRKYIQDYINNNSHGIDVIEAPDWTGITAFMKLKKPLVIRLHGSDTYFCHLEHRSQKKKNFLFEKWALRKANALTSVSNFTSQKTKTLFNLSFDIKVIPNLIALDKFVPTSSKSQVPYIINFGSVIRKKGVIALARAFNFIAQNNSEVQLKYLGRDVKDALTGKMTSELIKLEIDERFHHRVTFISQVSYDKVNSYINDASVVCLPSYAEAFPMTWLEAMALEKPLVTSNIGWATELMIQNQTGLMVNPDDISEFSMALKRLLEDQPFANKCGKKARKHLELNFDKRVIVENNLDFYKSVLL
ncbi:glycosyltransferase [Nonlabens ulvanivorans]|uniref:Glycosyltransferase n=1 Tax=Nonlabens ulvanivorans TaxID=906888 RepID=A0A090Q8N6_NONUL|nr:glycosyltransferase family 4 protein [Nonlabens ulvanivorans]GAK99370.1 glycosyltransferase [Nonlabens ulvanivorans]